VDIPPQYQLLSALVIGVLVAIGAAYRFFADLRRAPERDHLRIMGAALGDSTSLAEIVSELREIRGVLQRQLDTDRTAELIKAIDRVADGIAYRDPLALRRR
jgi:hypothetical protein